MSSSMPPLLADPVAHLLDLLSSSHSKRMSVGLAGVPGSGKSTLAAQIAADVNARAGAGVAVVLSHDGFHLTRARLAEGVGAHSPDECFVRRGAPWTFDGAGLAARLALALSADAGAAVPWPSFDHAEKDPREGADDIVPPGARLLILEGIYVLAGSAGWDATEGAEWNALPPLLSARLFLDTPREVADARLAARHMSAWGFSLEQARERIDANDGPNGDLVVATRASADHCVLSREHAEQK